MAPGPMLGLDWWPWLYLSEELLGEEGIER